MQEKSVNYRKIGRMVREMRKKAGLTQMALAEKIELSPQYLSKIEMGKKQISLQALYNIAFTLDVSMDLLTGYEPKEKKGKISQIDVIMEDCNEYERQIILEMMFALKEILRGNEEAEKGRENS